MLFRSLSTHEDFINAAIESAADIIMVSSLYGHGEMDCRGLKEKAIEAGLKDVLLYVGGNIVVGKQDFFDVEKRFKDMGFDRVFPPGFMIEQVLPILAKDLGVKLGKVISYYEGGSSMRMYDGAKTMSSGNVYGESSAPVLPKGENKITSSVTITYEIK